MSKPVVYGSCRRCSIEFKKRRSTTQFCSTECRISEKSETVLHAACEICGTEFIGQAGKPNRYCSRRCYTTGRLQVTLEEKLWTGVVKSIEPDGCWERTGPRGYREPSGYTNIYHDGKKEGAHRISYRLNVGPIGDDELACHTCDNPPCVRPDHLFKGDHLANNRDMAEKGRSAKGERNGRYLHPESTPRGEQVYGSKLTPECVSEIRRLHDEGVTQLQLAEMFQVRQSTISCIVLRKTWKHVA